MMAAMLPKIKAVTIDPIIITKEAITVYHTEIGAISPPTIKRIL